MSAAEDDVRARRQLAVEDCQKMIDWYEKNKRIPRRLYYTSQTATIVFSALTPVLILWTEMPKALQALPAALASIAAALAAVYRWRENWVLRAHTSEALKRELVKFRARASEHYRAGLDDQTALDNFVSRVESLAMGEVSEWRLLQLQGAKESVKPSQ
ncbi:MAG: DUF4231 domain-containing protein [Acidobacteriota bacterium]|nr:DUF4231 domain-containing protein [Acidobacteriota bacterium]MDQ5835914.1 DUF4231 domain-containing protein [Acidobacteriota bacterium]